MADIDEIKLSCYLDGSLSYNEACEVADFIQQDKETATKMLQLLQSHALLSSFSNDIQNQPIPDYLQPDFIQTKKRFFPRKMLSSTLQAAAVVILLVTGFFFSKITPEAQQAASSIFPQIPSHLVTTINRTLEYAPSGKHNLWSNETEQISAVITPKKTFKDSDGHYYRYYLIEIKENKSNTQYAAFAQRLDKEHWQTRSFFTQNNSKKIIL